MNKSKKQSIAAAVRRWLRAETPAKASSRFMHLKELAELGGIDFSVILYCRVSTRQQDDKGYLDSQLARLRRGVEEAGFEIARYGDEEVVLTEVSKGRISRDGLELVRLMAEDLCAIPVAEDVSRFFRAEDFDPIFNPSAQITENDIDKFRQKNRGTPFATIIHPNANYKEIKSHQARWGQEAKGNKGGRPKKNKPGYKKRRRHKKLPKVLRLRKKGASWGDIFALTGIPKTTARDWVKEGNK